jgi:hypothetical protein
MDCTTIGASPPMVTPPIWIGLVMRLALGIMLGLLGRPGALRRSARLSGRSGLVL